MCNHSVLQQLMADHDVELVYATFHVDVNITPFFVAVDYQRQKVIISIRGTLSLKVCTRNVKDLDCTEGL